MADSISLPIQILTVDAVEQIKKFATFSDKVLKNIGSTSNKANEQVGKFDGSFGKIASAAKLAGVAVATAFAGRALFKGIANNTDALKKFGLVSFNTFKFLENVVGTGAKLANTAKGILNIVSASKLLIGTLAAVFASRFIFSSITALTDKATEFENALTGVNSVAKNFGITTEAITGTVSDLAADGLVPVAQIANSLKNLLATGLNLEQSTKLFITLKDAAAFGRQGFLELGQAIEGATQGIKNGQSTLVDNAGITKNLSVLQKEYAGSIGTTIGKLTAAQKLQAVYQGILKEGSIFTGDAAKLQENYTGATAKLSFSFTQLLVQIGEFITKNSFVRDLIKGVATSFDFLRAVLKQNKFILELLLNVFLRLSVIVLISLNVIALAKAVRFLSTTISKDLTKSILNIPLPFVQKSLKELLLKLGIVAISVKSLGKAFTTFSSFALGALKVAINKVVTSLGVLGRSFLTLIKNPVTIVITAIVGSLVALGKALAFIEERTGIFSELLSIAGELIGETTAILDPLVSLFKGFGSIIGTVARQIAGLFVVALTKLISVAVSLIKLNPFNIFNKDQVKRISDAKDRLDGLSDGLVKVGFDISKLKKDTSRSVASINNSFKEIDLAPLLKLRGELKDVGLTDIQKLRRQRDERLAVIAEALNSEGKALKIAKELEIKINQDFAESVAKINKTTNKESIELIERLGSRFSKLSSSIKQSLGKVGQSVSSAFNFAFGTGASEQKEELSQLEKDLDKAFNDKKISKETFDIKKNDLKDLRKELTKNTKLAVGTGILNSFAQGSKGATSLATGLGAIVADSFVPGLGQAAGPLLEVFAQGPEATKQAFNEFAQTVPTVIENLILAIPAAIEALADNVDIIIFRIVDRLDEIIIALVKAMPRVSIALALAMAIDVPIALAKAMPDVVWSLIKELVKALPQAFIDAIRQIVGEFYNLGKTVFQGFWDGVISIGTFFYDLGKSIFQGFKDSISSLGDLNPGGSGLGGTFINTLIGGAIGGGVGSVIGAIGGSFGFAKGGMIPTGFSNDTFPARLSSGELVVDRSTTRDLQEFLSLQSSPSTSGDNMTGLLSQIVTLLSRDQSIETSVDFNDNTLANIILNLSRNNARLA